MKIQSANVGDVPTGGEDEELFMAYSLSQEKDGKNTQI
jgi:hypothetical protein